MLKKCIVMATLLYTASAYAQSDEECLGSGKIAELAAVLMQSGESEEYVLGLITDQKGVDPKRPKIRQKVIDDKDVDIVKFVFTMRLDPPEARKAVYMKCMEGGIGYIDWSKHREAARAR